MHRFWDPTGAFVLPAELTEVAILIGTASWHLSVRRRTTSQDVDYSTHANCLGRGGSGNTVSQRVTGVGAIIVINR